MMRKGDLPDRTENFARDVRELIRRLPRTLCNIEDAKQLVRASGSVAANQIEADDPLGDKDQLMKFKICRKEAKESRLWLALLDTGTDASVEDLRLRLLDEAQQFAAIYSTIIRKLGGY